MKEAHLHRPLFSLHPVALAALTAFSGTALAQVDPSATASEPAGAASAPASAAKSGQTATIPTVFVTANRRLEKANDVAGSVNVLTSAQLQQRGVTSIDEVAGYVPGFQVTGDSPGFKRESIRGITTGSLQIGASVAIYLDEQPISVSSSVGGGAVNAADIDPLDLERIEVLKGPQGSLYGAAALGGLVKYVTIQPDLNHLEGRAEVGYTSGRGAGGPTARVAVNVPVKKDLFAVRVTAYSRKDPGYVDDTLRGQKNLNGFKNEGGRLTALLKPSAAFDAKLVLDTQTLKSDDAAVPQYDAATLKPVYGDYGAQRVFAQPITNSFDRYALTMNYDVGFANLMSVTSYARIRNKFVNDVTDYLRFFDFASVAGYAAAGFPVRSLNPTGGTLNQNAVTTKKVQELRLTSPGNGKLQWLTGLFLQEESTRNPIQYNFYSGTDLTTPSAQFANLMARARLREAAVYANATYRFTESFDLQAGARYTSLSQDYSAQQQTYSYLSGGPGPLSNDMASSKEKQATWLISPRLALSRDQMVYFRAASGYRPGGPNLPVFGVTHPPFRSDSIINYEVGYKALLPDAKLDLSTALFRIDWKDIQVTVVDPVTFVSYYGNGGKARSQGLELEAGWRPVSGLRLSSSLSVMEAKLTEDVPPVFGLSGDNIPFTPKVTGSLAADYSWDLGQGRMSVGASLRYVGKQHVAFSHQPVAGLVPTLVAPELPAYELFDLRASYNWDRWTLSLFVKNALNKRAPINYNATLIAPSVTTGVPGPASVGVTAPRTVAVSLRADF
jgi:outer membrane receptor protein involved in Fe transport